MEEKMPKGDSGWPLVLMIVILRLLVWSLLSLRDEHRKTMEIKDRVEKLFDKR